MQLVRGKLSPSTPGPEEHPRAAPFDFAVLCEASAGHAPLPKTDTPHKIEEWVSRCGLSYSPAVPGAILNGVGAREARAGAARCIIPEPGNSKWRFRRGWLWTRPELDIQRGD